MAYLSSVGALGGLSTFYYLVVPFLFVLTIVVFVHELGHFLVARWCGVAIKTFSIGFGPEIAGFNDRYGTRWRLSWIPLGGYVKFIDDENAASAGQKSPEELTPEERAHSFRGKSLGQRAAIVAAGPIANFVLAVVIFTMIFGTARGEQPMVLGNTINFTGGSGKNTLTINFLTAPGARFTARAVRARRGRTPRAGWRRRSWRSPRRW